MTPEDGLAISNHFSIAIGELRKGLQLSVDVQDYKLVERIAGAILWIKATEEQSSIAGAILWIKATEEQSLP